MSGETTITGSLILLPAPEPTKLDKDTIEDIFIAQTVVMIIIIISKFLFLITHPRRIKKIK